MKMLFFLISLASVHSFAVDKNSTIATVNGKSISYETFDKTYRENLLFVGVGTVTKEKVLNDLINRELGLEKAKQGRLYENPVVKRKMDDIMFHAQVSKDLEPVLKKIKVRNQEIKSYYNQYQEYRTAQILFRMRATPSKPEREEALKAAMNVYDMLKKSPKKFAELANKYSQTPQASNGGDVGFQPATQYAPAYFKAIKGKPVGHITPPVRTPFGFHVIKVLAVRPFKEVNQDFYKKVIYTQKRDQAMAKYFKQLRGTASISINKELLKD